jgi:hypothetical protein
MTRKVTVKVGTDGAVEADFVGFSGSDCLEEAEKLAENLARFGLLVDPTSVHKKTQAELEAETGTTQEERDPVPARRK